MKMRKHRRLQLHKTRHCFPFMTTGVWYWSGRRHNEYGNKAGVSVRLRYGQSSSPGASLPNTPGNTGASS